MKQKTVIVDSDASTALNAARQAISQCGWKVAMMDASIIKAQTSISLTSWGETVIVQVQVSGNVTYLNVQSKCFQLIDWGKNQENVDKFLTNLNKIISIRDNK
jgi:hypothetical protein